MGNEVGLFDFVKIDGIRKWFRNAWSRSFFVIVALIFGYFAGESVTERRIIGDCKYMNTFRIDHLAYSCNRKLTEN